MKRLIALVLALFAFATAAEAFPPAIPPPILYVGPGGTIDLTNKIVVTTPSVTPTTAQKANNLALIHAAVAACSVAAGSSGVQSSQAPAGRILLPGGVIDGPSTQSTEWGDMRIPKSAGGWGCDVEGVPGRTILRSAVTGLPFFLMGNHRSVLKGVAMFYSTQATATSGSADLINWGGGLGQHCLEFAYLVMGEVAQDQCYNAAEFFVLPFMDTTNYGNAVAGQNSLFSSNIHDNYVSGMAYRCGSLSTSRTAIMTGSQTTTTLTTSGETGSALAAGQTVYAVTNGGITPEKIVSGSSHTWTMDTSESFSGVALQASATAQGGTGLVMSNNYCAGSGGGGGTLALNYGWVLQGVVVHSTVRNLESSPIGGLSTPAIGAGGDGIGTGGLNYIGVTGGIIEMDHFEALTVKANNQGLYAWGSGTNAIVNMPDFYNITATTANGATQLYALRPFGSNSHVVVNMLSEGGAVPINTFTNNLCLVYTGNTLTHTSIQFNQIADWAPASQINESCAAPPTNDLPVIKAVQGFSADFTATVTSGTDTATVNGVKGTLTLHNYTTAAGTTSGTITITDTNWSNTSSLGISCSVQNYTGVGAPSILNPILTSTGFTFKLSNIDSSNAINADVPVRCVIDNGRS